jgi:hypothetical protein
MSMIREIIEFIEDSGDDGNWTETKWERELTRSIPNWRSIANDPSTWEELGKVRPKDPGSSHYDLCVALLNEIGLELAKRWLDSSQYYPNNSAMNWLKRHIAGVWDQICEKTKIKWLNNSFNFDVIEIWERKGAQFWPSLTDSMKAVIIRKHLEAFVEFINVDYWNDLTEELKTVFLANLFEKCWDKDFKDFVRHIVRKRPIEISHLALPANAYVVTSPKVEKVRFIIEEAGDRPFLRRINKMISQREKAWHYGPQRTLHRLTRNERELVARLMEIPIRCGYLPAALPPVFVSSEPPPIFIAYPELEEDEREESNEYQVPRNRNRNGPEVISIEELLGVYQPQHQQIVIYESGIKWFRNRYQVDVEWLFAVVLIHEISHWITHQLPKPGIQTWPTDTYSLGEADVHEGWAQLMTWWVADGVQDFFMSTFESLNQRQSSPYRVFERFKNEPHDAVMASLAKLRLLPWPARIQDWENAIDGFRVSTP